MPDFRKKPYFTHFLHKTPILHTSYTKPSDFTHFLHTKKNLCVICGAVRKDFYILYLMKFKFLHTFYTLSSFSKFKGGEI